MRGAQPDLPHDAAVIDCSGRTLMAGLTDAHVHAAIIETDMTKMMKESPATVAFRIKEVEQTLQAGFTTVRDAFAPSPGFRPSHRARLRRGPRILFTGSCLTQPAATATGASRTWREPRSPASTAWSPPRASATRPTRCGVPRVKCCAWGHTASN